MAAFEFTTPTIGNATRWTRRRLARPNRYCDQRRPDRRRRGVSGKSPKPRR